MMGGEGVGHEDGRPSEGRRASTANPRQPTRSPTHPMAADYPRHPRRAQSPTRLPRPSSPPTQPPTPVDRPPARPATHPHPPTCTG